VRVATKAGMKPILVQGVDGFVREHDPVIAEGAVVANMKLIEGVVATYPDDRELLELAAMARASYAFGFLGDQLEALRLARPDDRIAAQALLGRVLGSFAVGRGFAERALNDNGDWADGIGAATLESVSLEALQQVLARLEREDASALFWLAFTWGGALQASLDPAEATQLPKVEAIARRALELDERVFYDVGPNMMLGVLHGFRAPALGGNPEKALEHLARAKALGGGALLPDVLAAQFVYAQTERQEDFERTLRAVIEAPVGEARALLDVLAKRKACRLLAYEGELFLAEPQPLPEACARLPQPYPLPEPPAPAAHVDGATQTEVARAAP
jgi:hypothetical protein